MTNSQTNTIAKIVEVGFPMEMEASVLAGLAAAVTNRKTWTMQDFTSVLQYWSEREWDRLYVLAGSAPGAFERMLFQRSKDLGCERPSEITTKIWTAWKIDMMGGGPNITGNQSAPILLKMSIPERSPLGRNFKMSQFKLPLHRESVSRCCLHSQPCSESSARMFMTQYSRLIIQ